MFDLFGKRTKAAYERRIALKNKDIEDLYKRLLVQEEKADKQKAEAFQAVAHLVQELQKSSATLGQLEKELTQSEAMLRAGDAARKDLAAKLKEARSKLEQRDTRYNQLMADYSETVRALEATKTLLLETKNELDELYSTHEDMVRQLRDGQEVSA